MDNDVVVFDKYVNRQQQYERSIGSSRLVAGLKRIDIDIVVLTVVKWLLIVCVIDSTGAVCPLGCHCDDNSLNVTCAGGAFDTVPILLNPELIQLNLSDNKITSLHYTMGFYNNLKQLDLSYNRIQTLGSMNFESQYQLNTLNISNNFISNITRDSLKGLKQLRVLDLSYNLIANIMPNALNDLKRVQQLQLHHNNLISFEPQLFRHLTHLQQLYLNNNQLLEIPSDLFVYSKQLQLLDLSNNLIEYVDQQAIIDLPNLIHLQIGSNLIRNISNLAFDQLPQLQYLDLSDNNINIVPTQQLSKLTNLTILNLSGNLISHIESLAFRSLFQLRVLHLSRLSHLQLIDARAFVDNVQLQRIHLDANRQLRTLPTRLFHGNKHIHFISMWNNQFETLAPDHFPLDQLHILKLSGDQYHCNCSLLWLWRLLNHQTQISVNNVDANGDNNRSISLYIDANEIRCSLPIHYKQVRLVDVHQSDISCTNNLKTIITSFILFIFVSVILFSFITYKRTQLNKCLPFYRHRHRPDHNNTNNHIDISAPEQSHSSFYHQQSMPINHHHHHIIQTNSKSSWHISYQEQQLPIKTPHIVFV